MKVTIDFEPYELNAAIEKHLTTGSSVHEYIKQAVREKVLREETVKEPTKWTEISKNEYDKLNTARIGNTINTVL